MPQTTEKYMLPYPLLEDRNNPPADFRALAEKLDQILQNLQDQAHPVGSYYWSSKPTDPAVLFGGTWEQIEDKFVFAASSTHPVGETGGEEKHTLTIDEMPRHDHRTSVGWGAGSLGVGVGRTDTNNPKQYFENSGITGGSKPHNNMPPYIVAYCWHRTA